MPVLVAAEVAWEEETDLDLDTKEGGGGGNGEQGETLVWVRESSR